MKNSKSLIFRRIFVSYQCSYHWYFYYDYWHFRF